MTAAAIAGVFRLTGALLVALVLAGCGDKGPSRYPVSGKITYGGKPVPAGIIYFDPDIAAGHDGPQGYAMIKDGRYDTRNDGLGHGGGKCVLRIFGADGVPGPEAPMGQPLFPEYTTTVELPEAEGTHDLEVPRRGASGG